ncbi:MAG: threonine synthase [Ruminococcaceae bacterium]|nr:threonine synthase [Oscillospiraceae bacterium]
MNYKSTRDNSISVKSSEAIAKGLSAEGGLFVPDSIPVISQTNIKYMADMSYCERAKEILGRFLTDFTEDELDKCITSAYTKEKFETNSIAPVYKLNNSQYILELWHGPTCAFKDMALQILPHLLTTSVKKLGLDRETVILVATSGDTGKAALEGFKDVDGTKIIVFFPDEGVSSIQRLQMCTQEGDNVFVSAVNGNFDDAQNGVKAIFTDKEYEKELLADKKALSSANSINWGRLVPQIVYYFSAYCDMVKAEEIQCGDEVNICVPTGNFGNILAAYYAKCMGLPVKKLICASNKNNVLTDFINTGVYDRNRDFFVTTSPSMDILISSNLERLLYMISGGRADVVSAYMAELKEKGTYTVSDDIKKEIGENFYGGCADDEKCAETIKETYDKFSYVTDTHTSVAVSVHNEYMKNTGDDTKTIIASTASPFKFNGAVLSALDKDTQTAELDEFRLLEKLAKDYELRVPSSLAGLEEKEVRFEVVCDKNQMKAVINEFLKN